MIANNAIPTAGLIPCEELIVAAALADAQSQAQGRAAGRIVENRARAAQSAPRDRKFPAEELGAARAVDAKNARGLEIFQRVRAAQVKWRK